MKRLGWLFVLLGLTFPGVYGQLTRVANTTLQMPANPAQRGYALQQAFGQTFAAPVCLATPPGETNRLFIVEKNNARILVITNLAQANPVAQVFLEIRSRVSDGDISQTEQGLLGLAFHPNYAENGYFFVFYTSSGARFDRVSRFSCSTTNANVANAGSELVFINQRDDASNHNGGDLHFGPDGYLYVSLGDEGGGDDTFQNSQRITKDFFSGILRIDVDKRPGNLPANTHAAATTNYFVPADNPFVGATNFNGIAIANPDTIRTEFWAVGLRNPWRMSFDPVTGKLWCGDVGQNTREEIDIITKGGNYGWNFREATIAFPGFSGTVPAGFKGIEPVWDYDRSLGLSVTGGRVYRGNRISQLYGAYIFGDYGSGRIWALRTTNDTSRGTAQQLTSDGGISAFGVDPSNGDILVCDVVDGQIRRLVYSATTTGTPLPATLADTGAFSDLETLTPNAGIIPYALNLPFWSDGAVKSRWVSVPDVSKTMTFNATNAWQFPTGAVWVKHFEIQTNDNPVAMRRLETRFIVRNTNGVYGVTYRWTNATSAVLVAEEGLDEAVEISEGGTTRTQVWHYPSRSECLTCHNSAAGMVLGFNTAQLNREVTHGAVTTNQISALASAGYLSAGPTNFHGLPALARPDEASVSQEFRVRSYLDVNCSQCHRPGGLALGNFDARLATPTDAANIINGVLVDDFGFLNNRTLVPGEPELSVMLTRMSIRGPKQMPPIASNVADPAGVALLRDFIMGEATNRLSFAQWQAQFPNPGEPEAQADGDFDEDGASNMLEWLARTDPQAAGDAWGVQARMTDDGVVEVLWNNPANRAVVIEATDDLFGEWTPLEDPQNQMFFPATSGNRTLLDGVAGGARYYRARITAP